ncbi:peptidyl-tRNA hydrolase Pth2 [Candidatus Woesearchaeota archaeon]|nr:peptidyl-tRNA hydrolase Pth2 [Candidatus Woesearchaeota archaeon]
MSEYKQVILVRNDLKLPKGKLAAQVAHASVEAVLKSDPKLVSKWRSSGMAKIVLKVNELKELRKYQVFAKENGLVTATITDAGKTVVAPGTVTCMAIGPSIESEIDKVTNELKLL